MDTDNKMSSKGFDTLVGVVASYDDQYKVYLIRPIRPNAFPIKCPALDTGFDAPYSVGDRVALHFYSNYGHVIVGRLPAPTAQEPLSPQQSDDQPAEEITGHQVSYRDPLDKDRRFYAKDGDFRVRFGKVEQFLSRIGAYAIKVSESCVRYMTETLHTIKDVCFTYIRSQPGITLVSDVDTQQDSERAGQPQVALEIVPKDSTNTMQFVVGGGSVENTDGLSATLGQLVRLMLKLTPANPSLEYTHGTERVKVRIDLHQFLVQFATAQFTWSDTGLTITQGKSRLSLSAADILEIMASSLTLLLSGNVDLQAAALNVNAPAKFVTPVNIQGFDALTVYTTLNTLITVFNAHNHLLGPLPTTPPTSAGAVLPVIPTV